MDVVWVFAYKIVHYLHSQAAEEAPAETSSFQDILTMEN